MKIILRWLFKINRKYDQMREPWRFLIFIGPPLIFGILGVLGYFLFDMPFLEFSTYIIMLVMGIFRLPVFFINHSWVNTYKIGLPYKFKHRVQVKYFNDEDRKDISKWTSKNMKFYRGIFVPNKGAEFYFARQSDAAAFKLRWI